MGVVAVPVTGWPKGKGPLLHSPGWSSPGWPPLILGVSLVVQLPAFTDFSDFLGRLFLVIVGVVFTSTISLYARFFFRNRPLGKSPHQSCRAFRGEVDSSIPRVSGGLLVVVFEA